MNNKVIIVIVVLAVLIGGGVLLAMSQTSQTQQNTVPQTQTTIQTGSPSATVKNAVTIQNMAFMPATLTVKVGDQVLYGKYAGTEITYDGKEYLIMRETDIYAVL